MIKLGSLPLGWRWVEANNVMDVRDGTHDSPKAQTSGVPLVTSKNLVNGEIDFSTCNLISESDHEAISKRSGVDNGDILYAMIGTIGNPVVVNKAFEFSIKNVALFKFTKTNEAYNQYIFHFLNSRIAIRQFQSNSRGGTQKFVSLGNIRGLQIPLPPLAEQKRIAAILDKADAIRRKRQQTIQLADDFLRSVFLDMFGDPVTNPKGWEVKPIKKLATVTTGGTPSRKVPEYYGNDIEWIKSDNINTPQHILTKASEYLSNEGRKVARTAPKGSTLITCIAGSFDCIGNAAFTDREVSFNQQINALTPKEGVLSWFLYALIIFSKKIIQNASTSSMKGMISKGKLENVELIHPPIELQRKFELVFNKQINSVDRLNKSYKKTNEMFKSLSQKAFTGEL